MKALKFYLKCVIPAILAVGGLIEGVSYALSLLNAPSDVAVLGGATLLTFTLIAFSAFIVSYFINPISRSI